jgi:hypothetical protein
MRYIEDLYIAISSAIIHTIIISTIIYLLYRYSLIPKAENTVDNIIVNYVNDFINNLETRINKNAVLKDKINRQFINNILLDIIPKSKQSEIDNKNNIDTKNAAQNKPIQNKIILVLSLLGLTFISFMIVYYLFLSKYINMYTVSFEERDNIQS